MRLIIVSPELLPVPPYEGYGGTERVVYDLATGLARKGNVVHLIASAYSRISIDGVTLHGFMSRELSEYTGMPGFSKRKDSLKDAIHNQYDRYIVGEISRIVKSQKIDLINLHMGDEPLLRRLHLLGIPILMSCHFVLNPEDQQRYGKYCTFIVQSKSQQKDFKKAVAVLQGIRTDHIPFSSKTLVSSDEEPTLDVLKRLKSSGKDYLLILSRIDSRKGQHTAIRIAKRAGLPLIIAGTPYIDSINAEGSSIRYFEDTILPRIDDENVIYFGNADEVQKYELMKFSMASVFPTGFEDRTWNEPFGRVIAESLATGSPVVGYRGGGAISEQVVDGVHGFLFETEDQAVESLKRIGDIDREECARHARTLLDSVRFVRDMEKEFIRHGGIVEGTSPSET